MRPLAPSRRRLAVLLPCLDEEVAIGGVVTDFRRALPEAIVYVFDNDSTDRTAAVAAAAGATVVRSPRRGKGHVVQHMFETVDADIYVLADGDGTYPADRAPELVRLLEESGAAMVVGSRVAAPDSRAFKPVNRLGNRILSRLIDALFDAELTDVLSGYRVMTRDFVRSFRSRSPGFEIETEITLQALVRRRAVRELPIPYVARPAGSHSKLSALPDGLQIIRVIVTLFKDYKPLRFFLTLSVLATLAGLAAGWLPVADYVETRFVRHVPLALLAAALEILAVLFAGTGLVLDALVRFHVETLEGLDAVRRERDAAGPPVARAGVLDRED